MVVPITAAWKCAANPSLGASTGWFDRRYAGEPTMPAPATLAMVEPTVERLRKTHHRPNAIALTDRRWRLAHSNGKAIVILMTKSNDDAKVSLTNRDERDVEGIEAAHIARVESGLADVREGRLATPSEVDTAFAQFRRRV